MYQITNKQDEWHIIEDGIDWGVVYSTWSEAYDELYKIVKATQ